MAIAIDISQVQCQIYLLNLKYFFLMLFNKNSLFSFSFFFFFFFQNYIKLCLFPGLNQILNPRFTVNFCRLLTPSVSTVESVNKALKIKSIVFPPSSYFPPLRNIKAV